MILQLLKGVVSPGVYRDFLRHIRNFNFDVNDAGDLLVARVAFNNQVVAIMPDGSEVTTKNLVTTEGLNHFLDVVLHGTSAISTWYVAPFAGNVTPSLTWTAANFNSNATELSTEYSEATRVEYVEAAASGGSTNNTASPATITAAQDSVNIWGAGLLSVSTKQSTAGVLLAAAKYGTVRTLATTSDTLGIKYTLALSNS